MIDLQAENVLSLTAACNSKILPPRRGGKRPNVATFYRWALRGVRGVILETIQVGGTKCTSTEALQRFCERLSSAPQPLAVIPETPRRRREAIERARRELMAA